MTTTKRGPGRPKLPESERKVYINFMAPRQTRQLIAKRAKEAKLSRSVFLTQLINAQGQK